MMRDNTYRKEKNKNYIKYYESIIEYEKFIDDIAKLLYDLGIKDELSVFCAYSYLLHNGYFSKNKKFVYSVNDRMNLTGYYGIDIINGKGVCLNNADMLKSICQKMGYESHLVANIIAKDVEYNYRPQILIKKRKVKETPKSFINDQIGSIIGNHVCTLIRRDEIYYVYDPTNFFVSKLDKHMRASIIGSEREIIIKPKLSISSCGIKINEMEKILNSYKNFHDKKDIYKIEDIAASFNKNIELCENNQLLLNDFYYETSRRKQKILKIFKEEK